MNPDLENPIKPWENEIWTPEILYRGQTVFCIASGPSLTLADVKKLTGKPVIVVNSSCMVTLEAGITDATLFFTDNGWYMDRREIVKNWSGIVACLSRLAKRELPEKVKRVKPYGSPDFPPRFPAMGSGEIQQGRTSGHTAVALAIAMGAARVVLLGYDMQMVNGKEHHHDEYKGPRDLKIYENEFQKSFNGWNAAALAIGVQIINCTHGSAVKEFPFLGLDAVLARCS